MLELSFYFRKKKRNNFAFRVLAGEAIAIAIVIFVCIYNIKAALTIFIVPIIFTRFSMMAGNWAQHAFINPDNPANVYTNSITCINTGYNKKCFNDGYHIGHHLRPSLHWTDMPNDFLQNIEKYRQNEAVVFNGLDYFQIWFLLMIKNYSYLSKKFVPLTENIASTNEIKSFLKSRTSKVFSAGDNSALRLARL